MAGNFKVFLLIVYDRHDKIFQKSFYTIPQLIGYNTFAKFWS